MFRDLGGDGSHLFYKNRVVVDVGWLAVGLTSL